MIELRIGYDEKLGDMVYDEFLSHPELVGKDFFIRDRETSKNILQNMTWFCGAWDGNTPVAAWWGKDNEIQLIVRENYKCLNLL